jgi:hypothetical protein
MSIKVKHNNEQYNVTLRRVHESLLPWKSNKYYLLVCACACVRTSACSLAYQACNAYAPYCDVVCSPSVSATFFDIINGAIFGGGGGEVSEHKMCFGFLYNFYLDVFM